MNTALHETSLTAPTHALLDPMSDAVSAYICASRYAAVGAMNAQPTARLSGVTCGDVNVVRYEGIGASRCDRRIDHIRIDNTDRFVLCVPVAARICMRHSGVDTEITPGEFIFVSTLKPIHGAMVGLGADGSCTSLFVRVPGPALRRRIAHIDTLCNLPFQMSRGAGGIMRSFFDVALREGEYLSETEAGNLGMQLLEAIYSATARQAEGERACQRAERPTSAVRTLDKARSFIDAHLSDPTLTAARVAEHCRVSVRYLHLVFAPTGSTMAAYIRESRLQACRAALRDERLRHCSIIEIAGRWGLEDPAHFSRSYKQRFGVPPKEDRAR